MLRSRFLWLALLLLLCTQAPLRAQNDVYLTEDRRLDYEAFKNLLALSADSPAPEKEKLDLLEIAARTLVYPITNPQKQSPLTPGSLDKVLTDLDFYLKSAYTKPSNEAVRARFRDELVTASMKILSNFNQPLIAQVNAARALALLAERCGDAKLTDPLVALIADQNRSDGVKYYALRGLGSVLQAARKSTPPGFKDKTAEQKCLTTLVAFIERKPELFERTPKGEIEGLKIIRREAIRALTETRVPALPAVKDSLVALALLRVVSKDGLVPEPRLDEQVEAAIGLCQLDPKLNADYALDYAAQHVGWLVVHLAQAYQDPSQKGEPWKIHAARLSDAMQNWKDVKDPFVQAVFKDALLVLDTMEDGKNPNAQNLALLLNNRKPASTSVYKSDPKSTVKEPTQ